MSGTPRNGPVEETMSSWMRGQEKRVMREARRPQIKQATDLLGPGFGPQAIPLTDWNAEEARFNGFFTSEETAANTPDVEGVDAWVGITTSQGLYGQQIVWAVGLPESQALHRYFQVPGNAMPIYSEWVPFGGVGGGASLGGPLVLGSSVSDPSTPPSLANVWDFRNPTGVTMASAPRSIAFDGNTVYFVLGATIVGYDRSTWALVRTLTTPSPYTTYGTVRIGTRLYMLCYHAALAQWGIFYVEDATPNTWTSFGLTFPTSNDGSVSPFGLVGSVLYSAAIGYDGTNLVIASRDASSNIRVQRRDMTTKAQVDITGQLSMGMGANAPLCGVYWGSADLGAPRIVVSEAVSEGMSWPMIFTTTPTRMWDEDWEAPTAIKGMVWDGTHWWSAYWTNSTTWGLVRMSDNLTTVSRTVGYTWYDADAGGTGTHESALSPTQTANHNKRYWLRVTTPAIPDNGDADDPNSVRIYVGNNRQLTMATTQVLLGVPAVGAAPPGASEFGAGDGFASAVQATAGGFTVNGNSDGDIGDGTFRDSVVTAAMETRASGQQSVLTSTTAGAVVNVAVTFPVGRFATAPHVVPTIQTTRPDINGASAGSITASGFTLYVWRNAAQATLTVDWTAFAK